MAGAGQSPAGDAGAAPLPSPCRRKNRITANAVEGEIFIQTEEETISPSVSPSAIQLPHQREPFYARPKHTRAAKGFCISTKKEAESPKIGRARFQPASPADSAESGAQRQEPEETLRKTKNSSGYQRRAEFVDSEPDSPANRCGSQAPPQKLP